MKGERHDPARPAGAGLVRVADPAALLSTGRRRRADVLAHVRADTAGVYARFSGIGQLESSIERQYSDADQYAARCSLRVVRRYCDRARPGTTRAGRDGLGRLVSDAKRGAFRIIIIEDVDRLARDVADLYSIVKELAACGVEVHDSKSGKLEGFALAAKALIAAQARARFLWLCREGRRDAVAEGRISHRVNYGYALDSRRAGSLVPHPDRAAIVRSLFEEAARGTRVPDLAKTLSGRHPTPAECIRLDRGGVPAAGLTPWTCNSILSLLRSPIYMGLLIDGRTVSVRDPETGKVSHPDNPSGNWDIYYVPELDIVGAELWARAQGEISRHSFGTFTQPGRPLFKTITCATCGERVRRVGRHPYALYRCAHGEASPGYAVPAGPLEAAILTAILARCDDAAVEREEDRADVSTAARDADEVSADLRRSEDDLHEALMASLSTNDRPTAALAVRSAEARVREFRTEYDRAFGRVRESPRDPAEISSCLRRLLQEAGRGRLPNDPDVSLVDALVRSVELSVQDDRVDISIDVNADVLTTVASLPNLADLPIQISARLSLREAASAWDARIATRGAARVQDRADALLEWAETVGEQVSTTAAACFRRHAFRPADFGWSEDAFLRTVLAVSKGDGRQKDLIRLGPQAGFAAALRETTRSGLWRDLVPRLAAEHGCLVKGLRWSWLDSSKVARRKIDVVRDGSEEIRSRVEREAASAVDPHHAGRLRAVAARYAGVSTRSVAREHSVPEGRVSAWLYRYRTGGADALTCPDPVGSSLVDLVVTELDGRLRGSSSDKLRARLRVITDHLRGRSRPMLSELHRTSYSNVADWISTFDWGSIEAFESRVSRGRLNDRQLEELRALAKLGADPDDPGRPLTFAALARVCADRFGIVLSRHAAMSALHAAGIRLRDREAAPPSKKARRIARIADLGSNLPSPEKEKSEAA